MLLMRSSFKASQTIAATLKDECVSDALPRAPKEKQKSNDAGSAGATPESKL